MAQTIKYRQGADRDEMAYQLITKCSQVSQNELKTIHGEI